jgi:hypothetical protein
MTVEGVKQVLLVHVWIVVVDVPMYVEVKSLSDLSALNNYYE